MIKLDSIAVDCPDPMALATFYAGLFDAEADGDCFHLNDGKLEIWFQHVENYQAPTWPTQERGQQLHFDISVADVDALTDKAVRLGATLTEPRDGYHSPILLDPIGHPFCLIKDDSKLSPTLTALNFDCDDTHGLATFYQKLIGGEVRVYDEWRSVVRDEGITLNFQPVENYQPPTWPTQERGQQIHIDFHTDQRPAMVELAKSLGATDTGEYGERFTVMRDPAGHPFCICDD